MLVLIFDRNKLKQTIMSTDFILGAIVATTVILFVVLVILKNKRDKEEYMNELNMFEREKEKYRSE
jgi:hypothetical protein